MKMWVAYNHWGEMIADAPTEQQLWDELDILGVEENQIGDIVLTTG